jgi:hypothetical protein
MRPRTFTQVVRAHSTCQRSAYSRGELRVRTNRATSNAESPNLEVTHERANCKNEGRKAKLYTNESVQPATSETTLIASDNAGSSSERRFVAASKSSAF